MEQDPVRLLSTKAFLCPPFLWLGNRLHSASKNFPEFQLGRFKQLLIRREGMQDKGGAVKRNNSAALGQAPGSPQGIHTTISLSCFADTETPTSGRS